MRLWLLRGLYALAIAAYVCLLPAPPAGDVQLALPHFLVLLAIQAVLFIATQLLAPKPDLENARPKGLGDFNFPTATEGRQIPVVWGTVEVQGPNVIWYGDLKIKEITEKVKTGMFSSDEVVVGHRYSVGMDMAICHGQVDALRRIKVGIEPVLEFDTYASPGSESGTAVSIDKPELFGGFGEGGGVRGTLRFYNGYPNQTQNAYLTNLLGADKTPAYVDVCHAVWERGLIGESENIEAWSFEVSRWPNPLGLTSSRHKIGEDANPACVLYEIYTDEVWGLDVDPGDMDIASFVAAGNTLATEGNGFSYVLDRTQSARDVAREVLRQIDGLIYQDPTTGKHVLKLLRNDYDVETIPQFDEDNLLDVKNFARASWNQTQNYVEIQYLDRDKEYTQTSARAQDLANVRILDGQQVLAQSLFPGVKSAALADSIAWRELRQLSYPLAKAQLVANREAASLKPGDVIRWSWQPYGISNIIMRVLQIGYGDLADGRVSLDCIEDVFSLGTALFASSAPTNWAPVSGQPTAATIELVRDLPFWFILTDPASGGEAQERVLSFVARPNDVCVSYDAWTNTGPSSAYERVSNAYPFVPTATLVNSYAENTADVDTVTEIVIEDVVDAEDIAGAAAADIKTFGQGLALIQGATAADDEFVGFEGITDLGGGQYRLETIHRGLLDTLPQAHSAGARIWFLPAAVSGLRFFGATDSVDVKNRPRTPKRDLDLTDATARALTFSSRTLRPLPPGGFKVQGSRYPTALGAVDPALTWEHRNRLDPLILDQSDADSALGQDTDVEYELKFYDDNANTLIREVVLRSSGIHSESPVGGSGTWVSYTYPRAQIQADASAGSGAFVVRAELLARSISSGLASRATVVRTFTVTLP